MLCIRDMGAHVALISRGVLVSDGLLNTLIGTFAEFNRIGMVGPQLLNLDGTEATTSTGTIRDAKSIHSRSQLGQDDSRLDHVCEVNYLSLVCLVMAIEVWKKINLFDEIYAPGHYSGIDLSHRVRLLGYRCLYVPSMKVTFDSERYGEIGRIKGNASDNEINRLKLKARWHNSRSSKKNADTAKHPNFVVDVGQRVLVLDVETPRPDTNAGGYAAVKEMQVLQSLGYQVTFIPRDLEHSGRYTEALQRMGIECIYAPFFVNIDEFLSKRSTEFSLIYITRYHVALDVLSHIRQYALIAKTVLMVADLHFLRELRAALHNKDDEQLSQAMETRENELAVMRKVDLVLSYSEVEKTVILSHNLASTKVAKCPWVCDVVESVSGFENRVDVAFLGGFNHTPNVEAMVWFIEQVWPTLLKQLPEAQLRIYGSAIPHSIKDLAGSNPRVQVLGWVSDVASVYNSCRVFIAPLQSGAGIKGKVIGALAHGVPSVLSDIAVEGIGVCDEIHSFVASSPDEWVNRIMRLYTDQALWEQMSKHALSFAKRNYSLEKAIVEMKAALSAVGIEAILEPKALVWKGPWRSVAQV